MLLYNESKTLQQLLKYSGVKLVLFKSVIPIGFIFIFKRGTEKTLINETQKSFI